MVRQILLALALGLVACPAEAKAAQPISIGETQFINWGGEEQLRAINIYLPGGYAAGTQRYPVIYLIDGGLDQDFLHIAGTSALNALWGRSQSAIVVGIETRDRRAELIGSPGNAQEHADYPTAGNAAEFRAFIRDQVKPMVEAQYRTNGTDVVLGESLAGLFIVETWLVEPAMFDAYGAVDPSLWWQDQALARSAAEHVADGAERGPLLMSYSNEGPATELGVELVAQAAGERGCVLMRSDLTHATAYHVLTPQVLQYLLPGEYDFEPDWGFDVPCAGSEQGQ